jgi:hypothetical protein
MTNPDDKLISLPDGTWVRPSAVVAVTTRPETSYSSPCVVLLTLNAPHGAVPIADLVRESLDSAHEWAAKIGRTLADAEDEGDGEDIA